ncbi:MAG: ATP-binding cassette domain-containing protein, partial [Bacillota bacterium]
LSGGEQQRVAIAIALANKPELLLADEPTGSLDRRSGKVVLDVFRKVRDMYGVTVVIVTHDMSMAAAVDRYVRIADGKISSESVRRVADIPLEERHEALEGEEVEATHEEYIVLDSAGRLQIPEELRAQLKIANRVKLHMEDGKIVILPPDDIE